MSQLHIGLGVLLGVSIALNFLLLKRIGRAFGHGVKVPVEKVVDFLLTVGKLKTVKRTGWINHRVSLPESVSDHMYRLGMMALCVQDPRLDRNRIAKIGLMHDVAESIVGDIVPTDISGVSREDKHRREMEAFESIAGLFSASPALQQDVRSLWLEYELGSSEEGQLVKQLDRLEMVMQAFEYEQAQRCRLDDFFTSTARAFRHPEAVAIQQEVLRRRAALHAQWEAEFRAHGTPLPKPLTRLHIITGEAQQPGKQASPAPVPGAPRAPTTANSSASASSTSTSTSPARGRAASPARAKPVPAAPAPSKKAEAEAEAPSAAGPGRSRSRSRSASRSPSRARKAAPAPAAAPSSFSSVSSATAEPRRTRAAAAGRVVKRAPSTGRAKLALWNDVKLH